MNDIWSTYLSMFQSTANNKQTNLIKQNKKINTIIKEDTDDDTDDDFDDNAEEDDANEQNTNDDTDKDEEFDADDEDDDSSSNKQQSVSDKEEANKKAANLNFSADLAAEFGNTCNKFTTLAAKIVKERTVAKQSADDLTKILDKLKSLIEAAKNSI